MSAKTPLGAAETLGPVVNFYLHRLDAFLGASAGADTRVLMALRAGARIEDLYRHWRRSRGQSPEGNRVLFPASRMMAVKAAYKSRPELALSALWSESHGATTETLVRALVNSELLGGRLDLSDLGPVAPAPLHEFLATDTPTARLVRQHLLEQSDLYRRTVDAVADGASRLILIDSGWKGTSQMLLEATFPDYRWDGVYFGTIGRARALGYAPTSMIGLMFDGTVVDDRHSETAVLVHRHLFESLFEPGIASTEAVCEADVGSPADLETLLSAEEPDPFDAVYHAVRNFIADHAADPFARVMTDYRHAIADLARVLMHPLREEVPVFCGKARSFDLGRSGSITSVYPAENRWPWDTPALRVKQSIWQTGQIALEYPQPEARMRQGEVVDRMKAAAADGHFAAKGHGSAAALGTRVAVITRTKNRPLLLRRAAESVAAQTHADYVWVIVNDGGAPDPVEEVVARSLVDPSRIVVCHNEKSLGMEAASNLGIAVSQSDFIVIHDDDDSWDSRFLERTVAFLRSNAQLYKGVITGTTYISEEITETGVKEHARKPYQDWVRNVHLTEMAAGNFFAPIAFLFRRDTHDAVGGFDEALPGLGDWDFNLRFLLRGDIGVLAEPLANYHHRDRGQSGGAYSNSVIGGVDRHMAFASVVRNKYFRLAAHDPAYVPLASLLSAGYLQHDVRHRIVSARDQFVGAVAEGGETRALAGRLKTALGASLRLVDRILSDEAEPAAAGGGSAVPAIATVADVDAAIARLAKLESAIFATDPAPAPTARPDSAGDTGRSAEASGSRSSARAGWHSGRFDDGWIAVDSEISVYAARAVDLAAWLPDSNHLEPKTIVVTENDVVLGEFILLRGTPMTFTIPLPGKARLRFLKLTASPAELVDGPDIRPLGFKYLSLKPVEV